MAVLRGPRASGLGPRPALTSHLVLLTATLSGCYAPDIHNCELACESQADCAGDQRCGPDHLCATTVVKCSTMDAGVVIDARTSDARLRLDARAIDARVTSDAPFDVVLTVMIMGMGTVVVSGGPACPTTGPCQLSVPIDELTSLIAEPGKQSMFKAWTMGPCAGQGATCALVPTGSTTLAVQFTKLSM